MVPAFNPVMTPAPLRRYRTDRLARQRTLRKRVHERRVRLHQARRWGAQAARVSVVALFAFLLLHPLDLVDAPIRWSDLDHDGLSLTHASSPGSYSNLYEPRVAPDAIETALRDDWKRVRSRFSVPVGMEKTVRFWLRIYTEFTTRQLVLFDERHPELIYGVIDFRDLIAKSRNTVAFEILAQRRLQTELERYRAAFQHLLREPAPAHPTALEYHLLEVMRSLDHPHSMRDFARNFRMQRGQRDQIIRGLQRADVFFPKMERIFGYMGVPEEITRLSLVESSFNHAAVSKVGAGGVWQFMRDSAQEYLVLDDQLKIDERLSPLKASVAAASLLRRNYGLLKVWPLAITSYNHGFTAIRSLILTRKERRFLTPEYDLAGIFEPCSLRSPSRKALGWASRNFFPGFLAVLHAEKYRDLFYGRSGLPDMQTMAFEQIHRPISGYELAKKMSISPASFRMLNPDVQRLSSPLPRGFWVVIPGENEADDLANLDEKLRTVSIREARFRLRAGTSDAQAKNES